VAIKVARPQLPAILSPKTKQVLSSPDLLHDLVDSLGSPLSILIPTGLCDNVTAFRNIFQARGVQERIWYACKVNKSEALLEAASDADIGVDAASLWELRAALGHGIPGPRIGISGPIKDERLLLLAMQHGSTITIDALAEVCTLAQLATRTSAASPVPILVRLSGFALTTTGRSEPAPTQQPENGRFGLPLGQLGQLFSLLRDPSVACVLELHGFAFHIDNLTVADRVTSFAQVLPVLLEAREAGYPCYELDIGGGFPVQYISRDDWTAFHHAYVDALVQGTPFMFRDKSFGIGITGAQAPNRGNFYPHDLPAYGGRFLQAFLDSRPHGHDDTVADLLRRHSIRLTIEPGRALIDQTGLTMCRVRGDKLSSGGDPLLVCGMNVSNLYEQFTGSEYTVDPLLISRTPTDDVFQPFTCYLTGNLCLETDMLSWRPITFPRRPQTGDLLAFANTAGYMMDFAESRMHQMPPPRKVALFEKADGCWAWKLDDEFSRLDLTSTASKALYR